MPIFVGKQHYLRLINKIVKIENNNRNLLGNNLKIFLYEIKGVLICYILIFMILYLLHNSIKEPLAINIIISISAFLLILLFRLFILTIKDLINRLSEFYVMIENDRIIICNPFPKKNIKIKFDDIKLVKFNKMLLINNSCIELKYRQTEVLISSISLKKWKELSTNYDIPLLTYFDNISDENMDVLFSMFKISKDEYYYIKKADDKRMDEQLVYDIINNDSKITLLGNVEYFNVKNKEIVKPVISFEYKGDEKNKIQMNYIDGTIMFSKSKNQDISYIYNLSNKLNVELNKI